MFISNKEPGRVVTVAGDVYYYVKKTNDNAALRSRAHISTGSVSFGSCKSLLRFFFWRCLPKLSAIMTSRAQKDKGKEKQNSNQTILSELLKEEENRYCADCGAKGKFYMECSINN